MASSVKDRPELLREIVQKAGERMLADLRTKLVAHRGEAGRSREAAVREFLIGQLPQSLEVSSGFAFDVAGRVSRQLDLVVSHREAGGTYDIGGGTKYFRIESVVGVGQVKSVITSRRELWEAFENLESVANLDRSAEGAARCLRSGEAIDHREVYHHRVFTFLLVAEPGLSADTCREVLIDFALTHCDYVWPNLVLFLDSHLLTYHCDDGVCPNAAHARGVTLVKDDGLNLVRFVRFLADALVATAPAYAAHSRYLPGIFPAEGSDTWYSTFHEEGEPPPLVSQWRGGSWPSYATARDESE